MATWGCGGLAWWEEAGVGWVGLGRASVMDGGAGKVWFAVERGPAARCTLGYDETSMKLVRS
jgi:hypothetical protein